MKLISGLYEVGGIGRANLKKVLIAATPNSDGTKTISITLPSEVSLAKFSSKDFNDLTNAEFNAKHPQFVTIANAFYGERVTNSMVSELYDELSKFA